MTIPLEHAFMISLLQNSTSSTYKLHLAFMSQAYAIMSAC